MPYYHPCPHCGSNLDPGERCDCQESRIASILQQQDPLYALLAQKKSPTDGESVKPFGDRAKVTA